MSEQKHWLVRPTTIRLLWRWGFLILAVITLFDVFFVHPHAAFGVDGWPAFNSWYGFLACCAMVFVAKGLGLLLKRKDTYYDEQ